MYNKELIKIIFNKKVDIIRNFGFKFKNDQIAEDVLSNILCRLATKEYNIEFPETWLYDAMFKEFLNYKLVNKKYNYCGQDSIPEEREEAIQEERLLEEESHTKLYLAINVLPETQKNAILRRMTETHENTNTEKANYRHGLLKLREIMSERL